VSHEARVRRLQQHAAEALEIFFTSDRTLGASVDRVGDATAFRWPAVPVVLFNHVIGLGDDRTPKDDAIDRILTLYRDEGLPCHVQLSPLADQEELGRRLAARGLERHPSWGVLALTPDSRNPATIPPSISVEPVDGTNRDDFVRVLLQAFQMSSPIDRASIATLNVPDVLSFLARYDGEPAGTGQLFVRAGVGGLFSGGVLERFRRRGLHTALISARVQAALDRGLQLLYSETEEVDNQSSRDLRKQGFFLAYEHVNWHLKAAGS
jgi:GNAT superfamily N-acetyltransferase